MDILKIEKQVEKSMEDKQEFADLCVKIVPELIARIKELEGIPTEDNSRMYDVVHDIYDDVFGVVPTNEQLSEICREIPEGIRKEADFWGWSDTVVKDSIWEWMKENINE